MKAGAAAASCERDRGWRFVSRSKWHRLRGAINDRPITPKTDAISIRRMSSPFKLQRDEP
jgi:hypothetical protein